MKLRLKGPRFPWGSSSTFTRRSGSPEHPEAAAGVERLHGERTAATVAEDKEPPRLDAGGLRELRPPAAQERAVAVPADLDGPDLDPAAGPRRADDKGRPVTDLRCELVGDALGKGDWAKTSQSVGSAAGVTGGATAVVLLVALTRVSRENRSSTRRFLALEAPWSPEEAMGVLSFWESVECGMQLQ